MRPTLLCLLLCGLAFSAPAEMAPTTFSQTLRLQGITFTLTTVSAPESSTVLRLTPSGLREDNRVQETPLAGSVLRAEVADLNVDQSPEIYVFVRPTGNSKAMELLAWSANRKKSLSQISLGEIPPGDSRLKGHSGNDEYAVVENSVIRRFPVGQKMRQISYKLVAGEAGWILKPGRSFEF